MAQVTLTFDTDQDIFELRRTMKATDMAIALNEMKNYLRARIKYAPDEMPEGIYEELKVVRGIFNDILEEYNINIEEILE